MGDFWDSLATLTIVMAFTFLGWYVVEFINGTAYPKWFKCTKKYMTFPPLVGMIIFGIIGRNIHPYMDHFNDDWGANIRMVCLVVILCRGGMELSFSGKGLIVFLLTIVPQMFEATTIAGTSKLIFDLPIYLCFSLGFVIGAVSPAVLVPSCMFLQENGYGVDKEIPTILIAAASFDDIIAITIFGTFTDLAFNEVGASSDEPYESIIKVAYQILTGLCVGLAVGAILGFSLKKAKHSKQTKLIKLALILTILALFVVAVELSEFHESLYICVLFFGYMLNVFWEQKPDDYLGFIWKYMSPFLFGSIGAAIDLGELEYNLIPKAILVIFCGAIVRMIATYLVSYGKFTLKERIVIVCGWIPKATVQAAIGGIVLDRARDDIDRSSPDYEDYEDHGKTILTTAIICILITAPLGAVLTRNLGTRWLHKSERKGKSNKVDNESDKPRESLELKESSKDNEESSGKPGEPQLTQQELNLPSNPIIDESNENKKKVKLSHQSEESSSIEEEHLPDIHKRQVV